MRRSMHVACPACREFVIKAKAARHISASAVQIKERFSAYAAAAPDGAVAFFHFEPNGTGNVPTVLGEYLSLQEALAR